WWWVPLDGRAPSKSGLLDLLDLRAAIDQDSAIVSNWTDAGIAVTTRGSVWLVPVSTTSGRVSGPPRQLTLGAGRVTDLTMSRDGQVAFSVVDSVRVIERVPIGDSVTQTVPLYSDRETPTGRPGETPD